MVFFVLFLHCLNFDSDLVLFGLLRVWLGVSLLVYFVYDTLILSH
jgi:hypothetical protein